MADEYDRGFKDDLREDKYTFLNVEEFSEYATVDGVLMRCQIVHYTADKSKRQDESFDGLHGDFTTLFFDAETYKAKRRRLPRQGEWLQLNKKRYDVASVKNELGVAKVVLTAYRQNTLRPEQFRRGGNYGIPNLQ